jgi:hypothetical protein
MSAIQTDAKVMDVLAEMHGSSVVRFPTGVDAQGDTIYTPGYMLAGPADAQEFCFDNDKGQRCAVPKHRVDEKLAPAKPAK